MLKDSELRKFLGGKSSDLVKRITREALARGDFARTMRTNHKATVEDLNQKIIDLETKCNDLAAALAKQSGAEPQKIADANANKVCEYCGRNAFVRYGIYCSCLACGRHWMATDDRDMDLDREQRAELATNPERAERWIKTNYKSS